MRSFSAITIVFGAVVGWTLACSGMDVPDEPSPPAETPEPEPEPVPKPKPAPNGAECDRYEGVSLPLDGGTITACTESAVTIDHPTGDTKALRWDYANAYKDAGWSRADPDNATPAVSQGGKKLAFENTDTQVIIRCTGCATGGGGGDRPGRPGKRPRPRPGR